MVPQPKTDAGWRQNLKATAMPFKYDAQGNIVTADHGNSEQMWDPETNSPHTRHTTYDVPLIVVGVIAIYAPGPAWLDRLVEAPL